MTFITDTYDHTITQAEDGTWTRGGVTIGPCDAEQALSTFNGMAPDGWTPPVAEQPAPPQTITRDQLDAVLSAKGLNAASIDALFTACAAI